MIINLLLLLSLLYSSTAKLYQVFSLSRHGARYHALDFYDANETKPLWLELTAVGMRQNQRLGQLLRKEYIDSLKFLSPYYNSSQIELYTTFTNRTQLSAESLLYGLYPQGTGPRLTYVDRSLHLPPYSNKSDFDQQNYALPAAHQPIKVLRNQKIILTDCPNYDVYEAQNFGLMADVFKEMNMTYYPFVKRMAGLFQFNVTDDVFFTMKTMTRVFDASSVDRFLGRLLPEGFTEADYLNVRHLTSFYYYIAMSNNNSLMVNTFKFQKLINTFDLRTKLPSTYSLKWTHLSGHDTDILAMHLALNISNAACTEELYRKGSTSAVECEQGGVDYAGNVIIELHSNNAKDFFIKVRSNGKYMKICSKASYECDYAEFKSLIRKSMTTKNMDQFCGITIKNDNEMVDHRRSEQKRIPTLDYI